MEPLVSIACITYNHEPYIRQCLDGFVMQQTNFDYEIVIHDDASTDGTRDVIVEYCTKYPHLFRPIFQDENRYREGKGIYVRFVFPECRGKYIALCEGDDYWTDPLKLQKQVDILDNNDCVMCSSKYAVYNQSNNQYSIPNLNYGSSEYTFENLIVGDWLYHPLTVIFKRSVLDNCDFTKYKHFVDLILFYELLNHGTKGLFLPDVTAVYRLHNNGIWSQIHSDDKRRFEFDVRLDVYDVNKSLDAAILLISQLQKPISRKWLLNNIGILVKLFRVISRHIGCFPAISIICSKMLASRILRREELETLLAMRSSRNK